MSSSSGKPSSLRECWKSSKKQEWDVDQKKHHLQGDGGRRESTLAVRTPLSLTAPLVKRSRYSLNPNIAIRGGEGFFHPAGFLVSGRKSRNLSCRGVLAQIINPLDAAALTTTGYKRLPFHMLCFASRRAVPNFAARIYMPPSLHMSTVVGMMCKMPAFFKEDRSMASRSPMGNDEISLP